MACTTYSQRIRTIVREIQFLVILKDSGTEKKFDRLVKSRNGEHGYLLGRSSGAGLQSE